MREIKFRGRTLDEKPVHWVYGYLNNDEGGLYICQPFNAKVYVDPETVGQFTGMEDVNGSQIYEGDVVELKNWDGNKVRGVVVHDDRYAMFGIARYNDIHNILHKKPKLVGNVFDNKKFHKELFETYDLYQK